MLASKLFPGVILKHDHQVRNIKCKSFSCETGDVFVAIPGATVDGFNFAAEAIALGAKTVVTEHADAIDRLKDFKGNVIVVDDAKRELARLAHCFYAHDLAGIHVIGITGTNGKTTVSTLVYRYLRSRGLGVILIGTNGNYVNDEYHETTNTTPDIIEIYSLIHQHKDMISYLVMEVSSQAVKELRVLGLPFNIACWTNLSQDHLDYHKTMDDYKYSKGLLIARVQDRPGNVVILNRDSPYFRFFHELTLAHVLTFGLDHADFQATILEESTEGTILELKLKGAVNRLHLRLLGRFNVYNALSFLAICDALGLLDDKALAFLEQDLKIDGRMEVYHIQGRDLIIDFAHTPEGIREVLTFLNKIKKGRLITIIGCGGDRDAIKRPIMGRITSDLSDIVYFTEDNSRSEDPRKIISDIIGGVVRDNYRIELPRKLAIRSAFGESHDGDIIAILGKGHENYLIINNVKYPYSDRAEVLALREGELS